LPLTRPPTSTLFPYTTLFRSTTMWDMVVVWSARSEAKGRLNLNSTLDRLIPGFAQCACQLIARTPREFAVIGTDHEIGKRTARRDRKSTRLNSSHDQISYAVF